MWQTAMEAAEAIRNQTENTPVKFTSGMQYELARLNTLCPHLCDGSSRGVGNYLEEVASRSGCSLEIVSYAWRTGNKSLSGFLASLA